MHKFPMPGMRIWKTSISVMLCLLLAHWLHQPPPVYACIAAIVVTKENVKLSFQQGVARVISTIVGCLLGLCIMFVDVGNQYLHILLAGVGCVATIYFCVLIKHPDTASLSAIIYLSLVMTHVTDQYEFALTRFVETVVGIAVAIGVNAVLTRRKKEEQEEHSTGQAREE